MSDEPNEIEDEATHGYADYTAEELLEQAQQDAQATIMATALFLHQKGVSLDEWTGFLGKTFALVWNDTVSWEAGEFLDAILTNQRALGATVISAELGIDEAKAIVTGFPSTEMSELFSIDPALTVRFNDVAKTIAARIGMTFEWKRAGKRVHYTVRRNGA
ncbi:MAG: hypothetical protein IT336_06135 [Thermomicrobiales bacterium]|nr:hypothetical protein [Thermomicrobiales bacterium]